MFAIHCCCIQMAIIILTFLCTNFIMCVKHWSHKLNFVLYKFFIASYVESGACWVNFINIMRTDLTELHNFFHAKFDVNCIL